MENETPENYNYSVDYMKKAAFHDEIHNVLMHIDTEESNMVIKYLMARIDEITKKYK